MTSSFSAKSIGVAVLRLALWFFGWWCLLWSMFAALPVMRDPDWLTAFALHVLGSVMVAFVVLPSAWRRFLLPVVLVALVAVFPLALIGTGVIRGDPNNPFLGLWFVSAGLLAFITCPIWEWIISVVRNCLQEAEAWPCGRLVGSCQTITGSRERLRSGESNSCGDSSRSPPDFRTWTAASGGKSQDAAFIECTDGFVHVLKRDGTKGRLSLEKLSAQDREYVEGRSQAGEEDLFESA
jgi:hypothetical protein